jgi:hypothetical protein
VGNGSVAGEVCEKRKEQLMDIYTKIKVIFRIFLIDFLDFQ